MMKRLLCFFRGHLWRPESAPPTQEEIELADAIDRIRKATSELSEAKSDLVRNGVG